VNENFRPGLTRELFQLMKKLPRPKLRHSAQFGLTQSEYELLMILAINFEGEQTALSVSKISALLQITPAGVTHLLNPLEDAGCIERLADPNDRRVVLIGLTDRGADIAAGLIAEVQDVLSGLVEYLGEDDSRTLIRLLSRTISYLTNVDEMET
jgi:DNA-binding MarR family transcriptional regulator